MTHEMASGDVNEASTNMGNGAVWMHQDWFEDVSLKWGPADHSFEKGPNFLENDLHSPMECLTELLACLAAMHVKPSLPGAAGP